jgi:hypothetical protein
MAQAEVGIASRRAQDDAKIASVANQSRFSASGARIFGN